MGVSTVVAASHVAARLTVNPYKVTSCDFSVRHFTCGRSLHRSDSPAQTFSPPDIDRDVTDLLSFTTSGDRHLENARTADCTAAVCRLAVSFGLPGPTAYRRLAEPSRPPRASTGDLVSKSLAPGDTRVINLVASLLGPQVPVPPRLGCPPREPAPGGCP